MPDSSLDPSPHQATGHFLEGLRAFILEETDTQRQQIERVWNKPLAARVAEGHAIEGVLIRDLDFPNSQITLQAGRNNSRFREGDLVLLNRGDPFAQPRFTATLEHDDGTILTVSAERDTNWGLLEAQRSGWVIDEGYLDLSALMLAAIDEVGDTLNGRERILPLLQGYYQPQIDPTLYDRGLDIGESVGLNWSQSEALANAYATDRAYLVQGPPGTGKTTVLANLARALVADGERVFVTAFTHRAINNALNKIAALDPELPVVKIGRPARADGLKGVRNFEAFTSASVRDLADGYVVGATPFATQTGALSGVEFDTVIFDEASQITLPLALLGMLPAQKYIFFGDQHQLPPVLTTRFTGGALRESVFARLVDRGFDSMLEETYRLNPELTRWPNRHFYDGALVSVVPGARRYMSYPATPQRLEMVLAPENPLVFWDLQHRNATVYSYGEADAVVELVTTLLDCGVVPGEIGVVVPYRAQSRLIRSRLQTELSYGLRSELVIDTVERMQGQERDVVIVSLTTSNPAFASQLADFFFMPQRINVAVTRPRRKLVIIGSSHVLRATPADPQHQEAILLLVDLLRECTTFTPVRAGEGD